MWNPQGWNANWLKDNQDNQYTSITRAEGIEHNCVSVEQQALLGQQSAAAKVSNEVREKNSVSEV